MERCRYGEERRVKRVRVRSSSSYSQDDDDVKSSSLVSEESQSRKKQEISFPSKAAAAMKEVEVGVAAMKEVEVGVAMKEVEVEVAMKEVEVEVAAMEESREMVVWSQASSAKLALTTYALTLCEECDRGDAADEMLLCDKCDGGFHMFCLSPILVTVPPGEWMCPFCSQSTTHREFQMVQKRIVDYFSVQKFLPQKPEKEEAMGVKRQKGRPSTGPRLLPYVPTTDMKRRLEQMASLAAALTSLSIGFSDSLIYTYAPRTANRAAHEKGGMREMHKEDKETLLRCKTMCKRGQWPPLLVTYDLRQGFVVEADEDIKDMTFITEYTGEVDYMCCRHYDSGNSIMGLLFSSDPLKELVICPDRKGNIARFLSGINNHTEEGRSKQNVRCVRYSIDGEARVILIAMRDIVKGERLYYDYNAYYTEYPTQHFV